MEKKGQISVFILIVLTLLIGFALIMFIKSDELGKKLETKQTQIVSLSSDALAVKNYVEECLKQTTEDAIIHIGLHGGYYNLPISSDQQFNNIPYYLNLGENNIPKLEKIESQISSYTVENLGICTNGFKSFEGNNIKSESIFAETIISPGKVNVKIEYPITLTYPDSTQTISEFFTNVNSKLLTIYDVSFEMTEYHSLISDEICLKCMVDFGERYNLYFEVDVINDNTILYEIVDKEIPIGNDPFSFRFAHKFET